MAFLALVVMGICALASLVTLGVAMVAWSQVWIAQYGLFMVTAVAAIGAVVCSFIALIAAAITQDA